MDPKECYLDQKKKEASKNSQALLLAFESSLKNFRLSSFDLFHLDTEILWEASHPFSVEAFSLVVVSFVCFYLLFLEVASGQL